MKICESDITNAILSYCKIDIKSLITIKYYNSSGKLELLLKPNSVVSRFTINHINNLNNLTEGGFFVISIDKEEDSLHSSADHHYLGSQEFTYDYRIYFSDFIENVRNNKLNELGI